MIVLAGAAALVGALVQSATGFGFALVLSPALFAVLDPYEAVTTMLLLGPPLNVLVLLDSGREQVQLARLAPMLLAAVPGLALGVVALEVLSKPALQVAVGAAVVCRRRAGRLRRRGGAPRRSRGRRARRRRPGRPGFASGALTTSISVSGPPIVLWLEALGLRPAELRASLAASFLALNLAGGRWWSWWPAGPVRCASTCSPPLLVLVAGGPRAGRPGVPPPRGAALLAGGAGIGGLRRAGEPGGGGAVAVGEGSLEFGAG